MNAIVIVACLLVFFMFYRKIRTVMVVAAACIVLAMYHKKLKSKFVALKKEQDSQVPSSFPSLLRVVSILDFMRAFCEKDFDIFIADVNAFVKEYKHIMRSELAPDDIVYEADVFFDRRRDLLNKLNYMKLSVPVHYDDACKKALRILQATTYGMVKHVRQKHKLHQRHFPFAKDTYDNSYDEF